MGRFRLTVTAGLAVAMAAAGSARADFVVSSFQTREVLRYNEATGEFLGSFAQGGGLEGPAGVLFAPDGSLLVADNPSDRILRYDGQTGAFLGVFAQGGDLSRPTGLAFGPGGVLFVTNQGIGNNRVVRFAADGTPLGVFASGSDSAPSWAGLAFGPTGELFVSAAASDRVLRFTGTGNAVGTPNGEITQAGVLGNPLGLAFGADGALYVASATNNGILRYDVATGSPLAPFVPPNVPGGPGSQSIPQGLTFGPGGDLFVAATGNREVFRYSADGTFLGSVTDGDFLDYPIYLAFQPAVVPEPSSLGLLAFGLTAPAVVRRFRRRQLCDAVG